MPGTADLKYAYHVLCEARPEYARAEAYYDGDVEEIFASDKVAKMLAKSNLDELDKVNFARIPVDAVANRLHITAVTTDNPDADEEVAGLIKRNELDEEGPALHKRGCSQGDVYLMVWPETDDQGDMVGVNMYCNSPAVARVIYDEEHPLRKRYAIKAWTIGAGKDMVTRADLYYADRIERWLWAGKHGGKADKWEPWDGDGQDAVLPNEYGEVPFFHFRTARPYGRPVHYAAFGPQDLINKLIVSHAATVDYQSLPQRYGLIDPTVDQSGQQSDFDPEFPEDAEGDPESALNPSQLRNDPGELWMLQGLKGVGQFDAAQPDIYLKPLDRYIKAMSQVTGVPFSLFDSTGDAISGDARQEAKAELTAMVESIQRSFGGTWAAAYTFALRILGFDDVTVKVHWKPADQVTSADGWETIEAKIRNGVPREQALVEAGYPPEIVTGWLANLDDDAELQRRVELLATLGDAIQKLGSGVALGAVTQQQVATILDGVLAAAERTDREVTAGG